MTKPQIWLRDDQEAELQRLSQKTGRTPGDIVRHGVDLAIAEAKEAATETQGVEPGVDKDDWKKAWLNAAGVWEGRDDLDELYADLRRNNARRAKALEKQWHGDE